MDFLMKNNKKLLSQMRRGMAIKNKTKKKTTRRERDALTNNKSTTQTRYNQPKQSKDGFITSAGEHSCKQSRGGQKTRRR